MDGILFETERLYFRALQKEDLDEIMEIWGDEEVMAWSGGAGTREQEERSLTFYRTMQKERGFSPYVVFLKETEEAVGFCGFNPPVESFLMRSFFITSRKDTGEKAMLQSPSLE